MQTQRGLTLQWIEDAEEVHEGQVDGPPGEESEAPSEAQEDGQPDHAAHILQCGAMLGIVGVLALDPIQLHYDHYEHGQIHQKDYAEVGHDGHIEGHIILQPAAKEGGGININVMYGTHTFLYMHQV